MKFNVLKYNQLLMTRLGIYSFNLSELTNEFLKSASSYCITITLILSIISSIIFVIENRSEINMVLQALVVMIGCFQAIGAYLNIGLNMSKIKIFHQNLQKIADEGKSLNIIQFLQFYSIHHSYISSINVQTMCSIVLYF